MRLLRRSIMESFLLSHDLDLRVQGDPPFAESGFFHFLNQGEDIAGGCAAFIHDEVSVDFRHFRTADVGAFEAEFVDELSGRGWARVLEDAAGAGLARL